MFAHRPLASCALLALTFACGRQGPATLTLEGTAVAVANATVSAEVSGETFTTTADRNGSYALPLHLPEGTADSTYLTLTARGTGAQRHVELKSFLGELGALIAAAGPDKELTWDEAPQMNVTHVTTARFVLLAAANGGAPPMTAEQVVNAEKSVSARELLEMAAAIKLVTDEPGTYPIGAGTTVFAWVQDAARYLSFLTAHGSAVAAAGEEILADPALTPEFDAGTVPGSHLMVYATQPGHLSRGGDKHVYAADGTGASYEAGAAYTFQWTVEGGVLVLRNFNPRRTEPGYGVPPACGGSTTVPMTRELREIRYELISSGAWVDHLRARNLSRDTYELCPDGVTQPPHLDEEYATDHDRRSLSKVPTRSLTAEQFSGRQWVISQYYAHTADAVGFFSDLVTFEPGGTASARRQPGVQIAWAVSDGRLNLTYPTGHTQEVEWVDSLPPMEAFFSQRRDSGGNTLASSYDVAIARRADLAITAEQLVTAPGTYWQSNVNSWLREAWRGEEIVWDFFRFGFELSSDGTGQRLDFNSEPTRNDGDGIPNERFIQRRFPQTWQVVGGGVELTRTELCNGEPCMWRGWTVLDASADFSRIYILESFWRREVDSPPGVHPEHSSYPPRWNVYDRWTLPAADPYGP